MREGRPRIAQIADDPRLPIIFDGRTNEYQFAYHEPDSCGPSTLIIYHCPFCGGAAPASKRELLFHVIPPAEQQRLTAMLAPVQTISDALRLLGTPDDDNPVGVVSRTDETDHSPSSVASSRTLTYHGLSDVANVCVTECSDGRAFYSLQGKWKGVFRRRRPPDDAMPLTRGPAVGLALPLREGYTSFNPPT